MKIATLNVCWEAFESTSFRTYCANNHHDENRCIQEIRTAIDTCDADFICLQECKRKYVHLLLGTTTTNYDFHCYEGDRFGIAILFRNNYSPTKIIKGDFLPKFGREPHHRRGRPFLIMIFDHILSVMNVHFPHRFELQQGNFDLLLRELRDQLRPHRSTIQNYILCGDFNRPIQKTNDVNLVLEGLTDQRFCISPTSLETYVGNDFTNHYDHIFTTFPCDRIEYYGTFYDHAFSHPVVYFSDHKMVLLTLRPHPAIPPNKGRRDRKKKHASRKKRAPIG